MKHVSILAAVGVALLLSSCGKEDSLNKQETQRNTFLPELRGAWQSNCEGKQIRRVSLDGERMTFEKTLYFDPDCRERVRTSKHSGKYALAHNYKEGIENSIIFLADNELRVTLYTDDEVKSQNNILSRINNEKEAEIQPSSTLAQEKAIIRSNLQIRAAKDLPAWRRDEEKTLNRLQWEKLRGLGLDATPVAEQGSRLSIRYEVDNGYLQITGASDYGVVYAKQP